ncbi:hypothetical protein EYF80_067120 [Liparis tanakae]|uniref:Uncharacterized protein n=1 Tax=Liparis tanakae TaxID=230148 RepID=A0A4Z2E264_9TELE|nr:hypothetical protein EYF80_067120 [Liparis tanakae]
MEAGGIPDGNQLEAPQRANARRNKETTFPIKPSFTIKEQATQLQSGPNTAPPKGQSRRHKQ